MYCPSCGEEISDDSDFCMHCGQEIETPESPEPETSHQKPVESEDPTPGESSSRDHSRPESSKYDTDILIGLLVGLPILFLSLGLLLGGTLISGFVLLLTFPLTLPSVRHSLQEELDFNQRAMASLFVLLLIVSIIAYPSGAGSSDTLSQQGPTDTVNQDDADSGSGGSSYSPSGVKANAEEIPYDDLLRNIEQHRGAEIHATGKITQSFEEEERFVFNIAMERSSASYWDSSKNAVVVWDGDRYIEDDVVEFWGVVEGKSEYETVLGADRVVPQITAVDMQIIDETTADPEASISIGKIDYSWQSFDSQYMDDRGTFTTINAEMTNTGQLPIEPTIDVIIKRGGTEVYSEEQAQSPPIETAPGGTQEFIVTPYHEVSESGQYTIEVRLRQSGNPEVLDKATKTISMG